MEGPKHIISVAALVNNEKGETLLVKTHWRSETWEMPGGNVELGESLDKAVCREVLEETGLVIRPIGITGIYFNATKQVLAVVFKAEYVSGTLQTQPEEIKEAKFVELNESNIAQYITRPQQKTRTLDALQAKSFVPYEAWEMNPSYNLLTRLYDEA